MKVLVVGGGGREHAIVDALTRSGRIDTIYCAPGNAGIAAQAECVPIRETEVEALRDFALEHNVTLTVVGPEAALAAGIVDCFRAAGLRIFGPTKAAARIESSKEFAKELMAKYGIPTAGFRAFTAYEEARDYVASRPLPAVLKIAPGQHPQQVEIDNNLKALQEAVGGTIAAVYPFADPVAIICNDDGKLMGLPLNRALRDENGQMYDAVAGDFLVVGLGEEDFASLIPEMAQKYEQLFHQPEVFLKLGNRLLVLPVPDEPPAEKPRTKPPAEHDR